MFSRLSRANGSRGRAALRPVALSLASAALLASGLTACSSGGSDPSSPSSAGGTSNGAFPVTVPTKFGNVTVKRKPTRVVALGWGDAEAALALGVQPVGASDWLAFGGDGVGPWAKGLYTKKPEIIGTLEPEYEKIAALKPDLILDTKSSGDQKRYDNLSKIAPTIDVPKGGEQYKTTWDKQTRMVADALGLKAKGAALVAGTEKKFTSAAASHPEFRHKTITVGALDGSGYGAYVSGVDRIDFVERLGFTNNPAIEKRAGSGFSVSVSRENLNLLDADLLVMTPIGVGANKITGDKLYDDIPAVKAGHSVVLDNKNVSQAFATDSVLSMGYALNKVVPLFAGALAK
ncbi:iron-siderophore ABC transporter substrate-binding protein [Streptomyces sp. 8L]|uniref:iron-siderophore ABC transporter substrate-binding protein n=1 Tax=Streptomyces sp. 8L TaxID=2877242 RepID=UPI001CD6222C|nr:iron-siderophore ABC transporter substrate-binding protein [Streptomyces sp. 8L]MCA1219726.1 iron-siderophore ABC transporter substrate-binding protein [Streptomyces sp. 8L]